MKILKILILFLFLYKDIFSCSCRYESFSYGFYKNLKHCFIGEVVKIERRQFDKTITFRINKVYKGKFDTLVCIETGSGGGDCGMEFSLNKTYLIDASYYEKKYHTSYCHFNALKGTNEFKEDTMLLNLFSKKNVFINTPYLRGQIKNGKPFGYWISNGDSGEYKNGKINGLWKKSGIDVYYKNGKFIKSIEYLYNEKLMDSSKIITSIKRQIIYYPSGRIHKIKKSKKLLVYYQNGRIKEKMNLNKHRNIYGYWYKYDESGKIIEKTYIENDNSMDADYVMLNPD